MVKMDILSKVLFFLITVLAFVFSFIGYTIVVRPQIQNSTSEYTLGFIDGGIVVFCITALPLTYAYLVEKEKKKKEEEG